MKMLVDKKVDIPVLAWDITFYSESRFDPEFISGAESLQQRGTDVIVADPSWSHLPATESR